MTSLHYYSMSSVLISSALLKSPTDNRQREAAVGAPWAGLSKLVMLLQDGGCQYNTCQLSNVWVTWKEQRHLWGGQVTICVWTGAGLGRQHRRWLSSVSLTAAAAPLNLSRDIISAERCTQYICFGGLKPKIEIPFPTPAGLSLVRPPWRSWNELLNIWGRNESVAVCWAGNTSCWCHCGKHNTLDCDPGH